MQRLTTLLSWLVMTVVALIASMSLAAHIAQTNYLAKLYGSTEKTLSMAPAAALSYAALPKPSEQNSIGIKKKDARALVVENFFKRYKSPLSEYAEFIIETSEKYGLPDFRIIPAIAMQESNGCKKLPEMGGTYNCWGYGIYGKQALGFDGYEAAIDRVARGLKKDYYDMGLTTPYQIMTKYTPPSLAKGGPWAKGVEYFMDEMR